MKKKRLQRECLLFSIITILTSGALSAQFPQTRGAATTREQYLEFMNTALDRLAASIEGQPRKPMLFAADVFLAHASYVWAFSDRDLINYVEGLKDSGAQRIEFFGGLFPFLYTPEGHPKVQKAIQNYDTMIAQIRRAGLQLSIAPTVQGLVDPKIPDFDAFEKLALEAWPIMAARYKPDLFVVLHEPSTLFSRAHIQASPGRVAEFVRRISAAIKKASPGTKTSAGCLPDEMPFFEQFLRIPELDFVDINIYDIRAMSVFERMIGMAHDAGKPIYVGETWRTPYVPRGSARSKEEFIAAGIGDPAFTALDQKWLTVMANWCAVKGIQAFTPSWTQTFFAYSGNGDTSAISFKYNTQVAQALSGGERTAVFETYRRLSQQLGIHSR